MLAQFVTGLSLLVAYILQISIIAQTPLISGTADLILVFLLAWSIQEEADNIWLWTVIIGVFVSLFSAMPFYAPLLTYMGAVGISKLLQRRVWQIPIIGMFLSTFLGTFLQHAFYVLVLQITGAPIHWRESLDLVILPSVLLNLIFALPVYAIASDLAGRVYPLEVDA
jgi:rod shape-determining protein MreD